MIKIMDTPKIAPDTPRKSSRLSLNRIENQHPRKQTTVRLKFLSHFLVGVTLGIHLKTKLSIILLVGKIVKGYEKTKLMQNMSSVVLKNGSLGKL